MVYLPDSYLFFHDEMFQNFINNLQATSSNTPQVYSVGLDR